VAVSLRYYTDPACSASWAAEPRLRRLMVEFGDRLGITYVMGGLAREFEADLAPLVIAWLDDSAESGMPLDPRVWNGDGVRSTYPACIAFRAAAEQGPAAAERYLRVLREGFMCHRRRLDGPEALVEEARRAGLDVQRFRIDLESNAILEAFGGDLEEARTIPDSARERGLAVDGGHGSSVERLAFPALRFIADGGGEERWVGGEHSYEQWREAALAAGAEPSAGGHPDVPGALRRFASMATVELEAVCDLPGPRAGAEAWRLASEWRLRRVPVLAGELWELA
jgi:protein-disulfide isomerase-like protein with CxxC motif